MDISGNKRPNNPAGIQSDAAGSSEKSIYQGKEDAHNLVPADEDRDAAPYSRSMQDQAGEGAQEEKEDPGGKTEEKPGENPGEKPGGSRPQEPVKEDSERADESHSKDDEHYAPESGDKLS